MTNYNFTFCTMPFALHTSGLLGRVDMKARYSLAPLRMTREKVGISGLIYLSVCLCCVFCRWSSASSI